MHQWEGIQGFAMWHLHKPLKKKIVFVALPLLVLFFSRTLNNLGLVYGVQPAIEIMMLYSFLSVPEPNLSEPLVDKDIRADTIVLLYNCCIVHLG